MGGGKEEGREGGMGEGTDGRREGGEAKVRYI